MNNITPTNRPAASINNPPWRCWAYGLWSVWSRGNNLSGRHSRFCAWKFRLPAALALFALVYAITVQVMTPALAVGIAALLAFTLLVATTNLPGWSYPYWGNTFLGSLVVLTGVAALGSLVWFGAPVVAIGFALLAWDGVACSIHWIRGKTHWNENRFCPRCGRFAHHVERFGYADSYVDPSHAIRSMNVDRAWVCKSCNVVVVQR